MVQSVPSGCVFMVVSLGLLATSATAQFSLQTLPALPDGTPALSWTMMEDGRTFWQRQNGAPLASQRFRDGVWESRDWYNYSSNDGEIFAENVPVGSDRGIRVTRNGVAQTLPFTRTELGVVDISDDGDIIYVGGRNSVSFPSSNWVLRWDGTTYAYQGETVGERMHNNVSGNISFGGLLTSSNGRRYTQTFLSDGDGFANPAASLGYFPNSAPAANFTPPPITPPIGGVLQAQSSNVRALSRAGNLVLGDYYARYRIPALNSNREEQGSFIWDENTGTRWVSPAFATFLGSNSASTLTFPANGRFAIASQFPSGNQRIFDIQTDTSLSVEGLLTQSGVDLTNWSQLRFGNWSVDGLTLSGTGTHEFSPGQFRTESWFVTIPAPSVLVLLGTSAIFTARRRR